MKSTTPKAQIQLNNRRYFPGIDFLRIFAAGFIAFIYHYGILYGAQPYNDRFAMGYLYQYAGYGVELFFAVSGFVLYFSYYQRLREGKQRFSTFFVGRIIRIYPVMILTVVAAAVGQWFSLARYGHVAILDIGDGRNSLLAFVLNLFGVQCGWIANHDSMSINGPTWFISIIMICYAIFFIVLKYCNQNKAKENMCFTALILLGAYLYVKPLEFPLLYPSCGRGYLNFFLGILIAKIVEQCNTNLRRYAVVAISIAALILYYWMYKIGNLGNMDLAISFIFNPAVIVLAANLRTVEILSKNFVVSYLGKISFSVYLWNIPIAIYVYLAMQTFGLTIDFGGRKFFFLHMILSTIIAILTYELYEKHITKWLKKKTMKIR